MKKIIFILLFCIVLAGCASEQLELQLGAGTATVKQLQECKMVTYKDYRYEIETYFSKENNTNQEREIYVEFEVNNTECTLLQKFSITMDNKESTMDFTDFGKCSIDEKEFCIICDSRQDGNADGICNGGESCLKNCLKDKKIESSQKNSREDYMTTDSSFKMTKAIPKLKEVQVTK